MENTHKPIHIAFSDQYSIGDIEHLLDTCHADASNPFLSKPWLCSWLSSLESPPTLLRFQNNNKSVGFVLLGKQSRWYGDIYYLNQTGNQSNDQMWIEHNDIIASNEWLAQCRHALLQDLCERRRFHRLVVSLSSFEQWPLPNSFIWSTETDRVASVSINEFALSSAEYSTTLSKNTRSAINRSKTYITKKCGDVSLSAISEPNDLVHTLKTKVAPLHISQWSDTDEGSGFENAVFLEFHEKLCAQQSEEHRREILSFRAGDQELGYLYLFLTNNTAFFYLSAINYNDKDNRYKPGLLMHKLAIEHYASLGYKNYDFLAGYARYKESLSNHHYSLHTLHIARESVFNRILFSINRFIKGLKSS